jgi:hypothetical protein
MTEDVPQRRAKRSEKEGDGWFVLVLLLELVLDSLVS